MRKTIFLMAATLLLGAATVALAGQVQVFEPMAEGMTQRGLREKAQAQGYGQAVLEEAKAMLPGSLGESREALLKAYFVGHAKPFIQGYKVLSSQDFEDGLSLSLDVRVDRRTLRDSLKSMGLMETLAAPLSASVAWPQDLTEEEQQQVRDLVALTNIEPAEGASPAVVLERGSDKGTWKCRLTWDGQEWMGINQDMAEAWFTVWPRYFDRPRERAAGTGGESLAVTGWFSPDGVLEFDRVLRGWDSAVQDVELAEMDMQPTGAGATWTVTVVNRDRLNMLLNAFLPQRGLSFRLAGQHKE
ncbi:MAG: hypothetical protein AB7E51_07170 [Pseudodesulfovibrio sp.]|jgi:hypothetical protein|uniref:Lipoprotein n=1 Tax=Pseudodesulfovibrio indicus TaxID=1716143 RepID=A0A126QR53_9BACT|nr:hypothetical protein [Pseudodesulfovibrio indicus]AMK11945.1 hypothetical protein AWY79_12890 [Pseudodesulfovibrio indicus]TDT87213.1 hypothetical protein EDC59_109100 [Pseudodesulfovibrio indicus]